MYKVCGLKTPPANHSLFPPPFSQFTTHLCPPPPPPHLLLPTLVLFFASYITPLPPPWIFPLVCYMPPPPPPSRSAVPGYVTFGQPPSPPPPPLVCLCAHLLVLQTVAPTCTAPLLPLLPVAARPTFLKSKDGVCFSFMVFVDHFKQVETSAKDII